MYTLHKRVIHTSHIYNKINRKETRNEYTEEAVGVGMVLDKMHKGSLSLVKPAIRKTFVTVIPGIQGTLNKQHIRNKSVSGLWPLTSEDAIPFKVLSIYNKHRKDTNCCFLNKLD